MFTRAACLFIVAFTAAVFAFAGHARSQTVLVNTGEGSTSTSGGFFIFNDGEFFQFVGMKFTLNQPATIGNVEAWLRGSGLITAHLRTNSGSNLPGSILHTTSANISFNTLPNWHSFGGGSLEWSLNAGTYWMTFEVGVDEGSVTFPQSVPNPLPGYAYLVDGNPGWVVMTAPELGLRLTTPGPPFTLHVPSEYPTIDIAMSVALNGQRVLVAPGTYNEAINFNGKSIIVESSGGADVTTIDASGLNTSAVRVPGGSGTGTKLIGFTVRGGSTASTLGDGGGMFVQGSTITVTDCVFTQNIAASGAGAAVTGGAHATFNNCTFDDNDSNAGCCGSGGGAYVNDATAIFNGCMFSNNHAVSSGGGLNVNVGAIVTATNCEFVGNTSGNAAGAALIIGGSANATFSGCTFEDNEALQAGAVGVNNGTANFSGCNFNHNTASFAGGTAGGGMQVQGAASVTIDDCTFRNNQAFLGGGVQFVAFSGTASITNSAFRNNAATSAGGGYQRGGSSTTVPSIGSTLFCGNSPNHTSGTFTNLGGNIMDAICIPENNTPSNPEPVVPGEPVAGTFVGASNSGTSSCDPNGVDVFFEFTIANGPTSILIDTCGSAADTALAVFDSKGVEIGCNTSCSGDPCGGPASCIALANLADGDYLIRLSQQSGALIGGDAFVLNINEVKINSPGDTNGDNVVDVSDLLAVINAWGACAAPPALCSADVAPHPNGDGQVNVSDLLMVINNWG